MSEPSELAATAGPGRAFRQVRVDLSRFGPAFAAAVLLITLLLPWIGLNVFWQLQVILMICYALVVCGINLSFGFAGELALGQVGVFAAGAYLTGWLAIHGVNDLVLCVWPQRLPVPSWA